ncbi:MAG TPA: CusA/CzcA family heavy metal efflux RND transporter [Gemmatimonadaceae bacterium]|nr:CusA/CzcA family heavy metal efflux RND transporter [Gemmatimonadaceae bacterium]
MRRLITFALRQRLFIVGGVLTLVAAGFYAVMRVPFDAFPDLTGTRVEVITTAPGLAPEEVERLVTYPLESSLMGLPGAEGVRSVSKSGLSLITVPFPDRMDIYFARTLVQQRLNDAKGALPMGVEPTLGPVSTPMGELYQYTVASDSMSLTELKTLHDYVIRPRLRTVPGVSEVNSWGGHIEQIQVEVDPVRLAAFGLTLDDVHRALADNNLTFGGNYLERAGERYAIRGVGRLGSAAEVGSVVLRASAGVPVRVADVATVHAGALPRYGAVTQDGRGEVVTGMVLKLKGADSRRVIAAVRARMAEIQKALPAHVRVTPFYDQTELVARTTHTIVKNLLEGGLLVIAILFLFLRNARASFIVASVIPLSMLIAFVGMKLFGYSANLMSLGALDFGLIVDASVVMVENFIRRLEREPPRAHEERLTLFRSAAIEVGRPVLFGIAIIVAVYIPIFTLDGMEGRMFKPMAFTVVCAVLGSLLLALTYVPAVSAWLLRHAHERPSRLQDAVRERYLAALEWTLAHGAAVVGVAAVLVVAAVGSLGFIGSEFMPKLDEGSILINTRRLPSVALGDATRLSLEAERIVRRFPEVKTVVTKEGRPDLATEAMGLFEGDMYVILKPRKEWRTAHDREGLVAAFDSALRAVPGLWVSFTQPLAMRLDEAESGIRTDLGIKVVGPDLERNRESAEAIRRVVASVRGAADVAMEVSEGTGQIRIDVRRDALARHGVSVADMRRAVDLALGSATATELIDGARRIGVAVRLPDRLRNDVAELARLPVRTPGGALVPLGELADLVSTSAPELIGHEDAQRRTLVLANVRGRDLGSFVEEVRSRVAKEIRLPSGMFLEWGGQYENQARAGARLRLVVPASLVLIYLLLFASFRSVPQAILVLLNVPFALVGGIAVLWMRGLNLSLSSSVGFIALFGIAVLNGVVLVAHLNTLRTNGASLDDAVRLGSADRLRPVLMTALVASLGFIPMAVSTSPGSEVQRPLASVVIGGLVTSTVLTLFVLPLLYRKLARWQLRHVDEEELALGPETFGGETALAPM